MSFQFARDIWSEDEVERTIGDRSTAIIFDTRADAALEDLSQFTSVEIVRHSAGDKPSVLSYVSSALAPEIAQPDIAQYGFQHPPLPGNQTPVSGTPTFYWTMGAGLSMPYSGGNTDYTMIAVAATAAAVNLSRYVVVGGVYEFTIPILTYTSGNVRGRIGTVSTVMVTGVGTHVVRMTAAASAQIEVVFNSATMTIGQVTCRRIISAHYFQSTDGLFWRPSGQSINPVAMHAQADGVTDDAEAIRLADACAWAYGMMLIGQETMAIASTVWLFARNFSMANAIFKLKDEFADDVGVLLDNTHIPDILTGEIYVDGNRDNQSNLNIISVLVRNMIVSVAGPVFNVRNASIATKVTGVSEEFDITLRCEKCNLGLWFSDEVDRPITTDITPNIVRASVFASEVNQFLRSEGFDTDAHTSFTIDLYGENNVNADLPAVDLLDPRGHYEMRGWLRGVSGVGIHANQKHQTDAITYDMALWFNGFKVFVGDTVDADWAVHVESAAMIMGELVVDAAFGGGVYIEEITGGHFQQDVPPTRIDMGVGDLRLFVDRLSGGPGLKLGTDDQTKGIRCGTFDTRICLIEDASDSLIVNKVDVDQHRRVKVSCFTDTTVNGGAAYINDINVDLGGIYVGVATHVIWNNEIEFEWIDEKTIDRFVGTLNVPSVTTKTFTPPGTRGPAVLWERSGLTTDARMTGYYHVGSGGVECTKDVGSANFTVDTGAAVLGAITADTLRLRARSDTPQLDIRNQFATTAAITVRLC